MCLCVWRACMHECACGCKYVCMHVCMDACACVQVCACDLQGPPHCLCPTPPLKTRKPKDSLIKAFPEFLQGSSVQVAPVAVEVEHMNIPLLDVGVQRQLLPFHVETTDCLRKDKWQCQWYSPRVSRLISDRASHISNWCDVYMAVNVVWENWTANRCNWSDTLPPVDTTTTSTLLLH